ncbi:MAG: MBL fold metallo-hydrolase [Planctomycetota bacterium]|nr:MBL fold metallo-hydrolase [Planctomycetota bacterium]
MKPAALNLEVFTLGPYQTNCTLLWTDGSTDCWIIDASFGPAPIARRIRELGLVPRAIILTHAHVDHIAGVTELVRQFKPLPVWIHQAERDWLADSELNLSVFSGVPVTAPGPDRLLQHGERLLLAGREWQVRHVPGHSPGSIALCSQAEPIAISGDALFAGSVGRTDFPGCSMRTLERSIREQLYTLPPETVFYPGHGPTSTIGDEMRSNPFVRAV